MSEMEMDKQKEKAKISGLAKLSLILAIISFLCIISYRHVEGLLLLALFIFLPLTVAFGVIGIIEIRKSKGRLRGTALIAGAIVVMLAVAVPPGYSVISESIVPRILCKCSSKAMREAIQAYASDHNGKYPAPEVWCDLLAQNSQNAKKLFCEVSGSAGGPELCHYALNPNCKPDSPEDIVLLFETKGGWNQCGNQELLTSTENYKKGWRVLFNDGRLEFIEPHELGRLKW
ncbi:MAG: hypothetical protein ACYS80_00255 [Planctomycetota bacterium]|jgi:hypothetical protein